MSSRSIEQIDRHILTYLNSNPSSTPKDISKHRIRENIVRLRCQQLTQEHLLTEVTHGLYNITEKGIECIESDENLEEFRETLPNLDTDRITDFSELDPEDIKWRNKKYLISDDHRYDYGEFRPYLRTKRDISSVRNHRLSRVMKEFPTKEPLTQQCAHWVRAIVGLHFFPDANHRTAMSTLNILLALNGIDRFKWDDDKYGPNIFKSKITRKYIIDVRYDNLWSKDELYFLWHRYFLGKFYDIKDYDHHSPDHSRLNDIIDRL